MIVTPQRLQSSRLIFDEMIRRNEISGTATEPMSLERQAQPGFMSDRFDCLREMQAGKDNLGQGPDDLLISRNGFEMKGRIQGDSQRGRLDVSSRQFDAEGNVQTQTLDLQCYRRDIISHYLVHVNPDRISALIEHVDREDPSKSWSQSQEWHVAGGY